MSGASAAFCGVSSPSLAIALNPTGVSGYANNNVTQDVTTGAVVASASGGVAPYSYAWTQVGTSPYTWTIGIPAGSTTPFTGQAIPVGVHAFNAFKVTVTDAAGNKGNATVTANVRNGVQDFSSTGTQ